MPPSLIHTDLAKIPAAAQGCVLAIGNFDGVHKGHVALIEKAKSIAQEQGVPLGVVTFEPHPRQFFQAVAPSFRITLPPMKRRLLQAQNVDHIIELSFDAKLAGLSAQDFISEILVKALRARHIVVGENFAFGKGRSGTIQTLADCPDFAVTALPPVRSAANEVYSSSAIRDLLRMGNLAKAEEFLGWPWQIETPVVKGDQRGRELGFPTANQNVPDYVRLPFGIYAVRALLDGETKWRDGVANFGIRPMFQISQPIFETFIFDFSAEIYGKVLRVQPVRHLRGEAAFAGIPALVAQMKEDCINARAVLKSSHV